ncbi:MAG: FAD-binding oxidoreductase [Planctomycetota bacterium]|jgi:Na+-transporting NADH:ubiquinone oxidoreductase subunit F
MGSALLAILLSAAAAGLLSAVLAALLLAAQRVLVNYGTCTIDVNEGSRRLEVAGGESLLASLKGQGIFIPSACGGRGTCAYCKLEVPEGGGPVAPTEEPLLTGEEIADRIRISCQVKVRNDLSVLVPEELFSVREYRGAVERIRDLTHDIKELRIRLIEPATMEFTAGQYVQLETPAYGDNPEPVYRAYSMSSVPEETGAVELIIRLVPGGICTTWVFTKLAEGDEVTFSGPYGQFRLSDSDRDMVWVAGGSGMAPFWSMVRQLRDRGCDRRCTYFFGAVGSRDMFLLAELRALERELDWFTFVPALSAPAEADRWDGETGLITEVLDRHVADGSELEAYLCGSPGMIRAAGEVLGRKGIKRDRTYYDEFA